MVFFNLEGQIIEKWYKFEVGNNRKLVALELVLILKSA